MPKRGRDDAVDEVGADEHLRGAVVSGKIHEGHDDGQAACSKGGADTGR